MNASRPMEDVIIIGGGIIGCAIACALSRLPLRVRLLEKHSAIPAVRSDIRAAVVYPGFDAPPESRQALLHMQGSRLMGVWSREIGFSYRPCGTLTVCFDEEEVPRLRELHQRGKKNHVRGLSLLWGDALRHKEPSLAPAVYAGLFSSGGGIVDPAELLTALYRTAMASGCHFSPSAEVGAIRREPSHFTLQTDRGLLSARCIINAAGTGGAALHNQLCRDPIASLSRRFLYGQSRQPSVTLRRPLLRLRHTDASLLLLPGLTAPILYDPLAPETEEDSRVAIRFPDMPPPSARHTLHGPVTTQLSGRKDCLAASPVPGYMEALGFGERGITAAPAVGGYMTHLVREYFGLSL